MVTFNFSLKTSKKRTIQPKITETIEGYIVMLNDNYKIKYNNELYNIDESSISTKNQSIIYSKKLDKYGHRIKIIRNADDRSDIGSKNYTSIAVGLKVKANIINGIAFITKIYNNTLINDIEEIENLKEFYIE